MNEREKNRFGLPAWVGAERWEVTLLGVVGVPAASVWGFLELVDEVLEGEARRVDVAIMLAMRTSGERADPLGPGWFEAMARDIVHRALGVRRYGAQHPTEDRFRPPASGSGAARD